MSCTRARGYRLARAQYEKLKASGAAVRKCGLCGDVKSLGEWEWPWQNGAPHGNACIECHRERSKKVYAPAARAARKLKPKPPSLRSQVRIVTRAALAAVEVLQAQHVPGAEADALRRGAEALNASAKGVMAKVVEHVDDPDSPFHREALEIMFGRILPMKIMNQIGRDLVRRGRLNDDANDAAGEGPTDDEAPRGRRFTVNVRTTTGA